MGWLKLGPDVRLRIRVRGRFRERETELDDCIDELGQGPEVEDVRLQGENLYRSHAPCVCVCLMSIVPRRGAPPLLI